MLLLLLLITTAAAMTAAFPVACTQDAHLQPRHVVQEVPVLGGLAQVARHTRPIVPPTEKHVEVVQ